VQGAFGELPQLASDQLAVVRACAYHLLNMLNMLRDVLKTLGSAELEATLAKCQLDTPIEEVGCFLTECVAYTSARIPSHSCASVVHTSVQDTC
jgi:hypothetical protein